MVVVAGKGFSLLDGNWLKHLHLKLSQVFTMLSQPLCSISWINTRMYSSQLGTLRGYEASIHVYSTVAPKFHKAHSVPYALHPKVDQELDQLVAVGVLDRI